MSPVGEEKESPHVMQVDLARNDVGKVSEPGSVKVAAFKMNWNRIIGDLKEEFDVLDVFEAAFPAGKLTGAPKIRAIEIIDALENAQRGVFGGAICIMNEKYLDSCTTTQTALIKNGFATVQAAAGIIHESDPQAQAQDTRDKARVILDAIAYAEEGKL